MARERRLRSAKIGAHTHQQGLSLGSGRALHRLANNKLTSKSGEAIGAFLSQASALQNLKYVPTTVIRWCLPSHHGTNQGTPLLCGCRDVQHQAQCAGRRRYESTGGGTGQQDQAAKALVRAGPGIGPLTLTSGSPLLAWRRRSRLSRRRPTGSTTSAWAPRAWSPSRKRSTRAS